MVIMVFFQPLCILMCVPWGTLGRLGPSIHPWLNFKVPETFKDKVGWSFRDLAIDCVLSLHSGREELGSMILNHHMRFSALKKTQWEKVCNEKTRRWREHSKSGGIILKIWRLVTKGSLRFIFQIYVLNFKYCSDLLFETLSTLL